MLAAEIYDEPKPSLSSTKVLELLRDGTEAQNEFNYDFAEACFEEVLAEEPNNCSAAYNLCTVWLRQDGEEGRRKAEPRLRQLHRDSPDYPIAAIVLAQWAAIDGDYQLARDLIAPFFRAKRLHISEAMALFVCQAQSALEERDIESAERAYELLRQIADEDDGNLRMLRERIDRASPKRGLRGLLSAF